MRTQILAAFAARYKTLKPYQAERYVDRYMQVTLRAIAESMVFYGISGGEFSLPITELREEIGKVSIDNKQKWVTDLMNSNPLTSLIVINFKGNVGKNTRASLNPIYENKIMNELINLTYELSPKRIAELKENAKTFITVEPASLLDFIEKSHETYKNRIGNPDPANQVYCTKVANNMIVARQLHSQIEMDSNGEYFVREKWVEMDSGRTYGHGLSLQRIDKHIRHAALGICHEYDFKASSFGLMAGLAQQYDPELKLADITDYIKNRSAIRNSIAKEIGISEKKVKAIFNALGFGANTVNNPHQAIRSECGSSEKFEALMANCYFKHINRALQKVRATILMNFDESLPFCDLVYNPIDPKSNPVNPKKRSSEQKLAWIYQAMESTAICKFGLLSTEAGYQPLMFAHDCAYTKRKLPGDVLNSIMYELNQVFPLLRIEHEELIPISKEIRESNAMIDYNLLSDAHKQLIDAQELALNAPKAFNVLDPETGYFAEEIKALNKQTISLGTSFGFAQ